MTAFHLLRNSEPLNELNGSFFVPFARLRIAGFRKNSKIVRKRL